MRKLTSFYTQFNDLVVNGDFERTEHMVQSVTVIASTEGARLETLWWPQGHVGRGLREPGLCVPDFTWRSV